MDERDDNELSCACRMLESAIVMTDRAAIGADVSQLYWEGGYERDSVNSISALKRGR